MQQAHELTVKQKFLTALASFLQRNRTLLLSAFAALLTFVIIYAIVTEIIQSRNNRTTVLIEKAEETFEAWHAEDDEEKSAEIGADLLTTLNSIMADFPNMYAGQRGLFIRGVFFLETAQWDDAAVDFETLAERFPKSYLAPVSLINAAIAMEESANYEAAIQFYMRVILEFEDISPEIPSTLFSIARLYDSIDDKENALLFYNQLVDQYPSSSWTNLARSRIICLKID